MSGSIDRYLTEHRANLSASMIGTVRALWRYHGRHGMTEERTSKRDGSGVVVGIDLGTTYSSIGVVAGRKAFVLADENNHYLQPSVISFPTRTSQLVGVAARPLMATDPAHTVASPKRLLGRRYEDPEVQTFLAHQAYLSKRGPDGTTTIEIWQQPYAIPQLSAYLLRELRRIAELRLDAEISRAVISVPVTFDAARLAATRRAAELAGWTDVSFVDEPTAAAGANRATPGFGGVVGVFDFGGGTFDFSAVEVSRTGLRVLATAGDPWLGGDDVDVAMAEAAANQFWRKHRVELRNQAVEWQRLCFACERAKRELASAEQTLIEVKDVLRTANGMVDLRLQVDRKALMRVLRPFLERALTVCDQALAEAKLAPTALSGIYLCGGLCHLPPVRDAVTQHFGVPLHAGASPELAVCLGAAIEGALRAASLPARP